MYLVEPFADQKDIRCFLAFVNFHPSLTQKLSKNLQAQKENQQHSDSEKEKK